MKKAGGPLSKGGKKRSSKRRFMGPSLVKVLPWALAVNSSNNKDNGKEERAKTKINVICYDESTFRKKEDVDIEQALKCIGKLAVTWINIIGPERLDILWRIAEKKNLQPFVIEDAVENRYGRLKIEDFEDHIYMTWNILSVREDVFYLERIQTGVILGKDFLISLQNKGDRFESIDRLVEEEGTRIRKMGADYLLYALLDTVMNSYFLVSEKIGEWLEKLQDETILFHDRTVLPRIMTLRRQLVTFRRAIWPLREQTNELEKGGSELISDGVAPYSRDVYDRTMELMDTVDTSRDMLSEMIDVYQSSVTL